MKIDAEAASEGRTLSEGDRAAPAKDSTTHAKSTQTTPGPSPVPSISSISALNEPKVWTSKGRTLVSAVVLLLLTLSGFLNWLGVQTVAAKAQKDLGKAELLQKAADQGNADAQNNLGRLYATGQGMPKDLGKAAELFQKAADQGNEIATTILKRLSAEND